MLAEFIDSWSLFGDAYLCGLLLGTMLSLAGVVVIARDQIFICLTVSQGSALGIAAGIWLGVLFPSATFFHFEGFHALSGAVVATAVAFLTATVGRRGSQLSPEAVTGYLYLLCASATMILLSQSPIGLEEIHRLLTSTILGATRQEVKLVALLLAVVVGLGFWGFDKVRIVMLDPDFATGCGVHTKRWQVALTGGLGVLLAVSNNLAGMLFAFGALLLPALGSRYFCREVWQMFIAAPLLFTLSALPAYVLANHFDCPPGQMVVVVLAIGVFVISFGSKVIERVNFYSSP